MKAPQPPSLPDELTSLLRRMRLPYMRKAAPEVCATARAQRWDPAEVLRVLITEEVVGRALASKRIRTEAALGDMTARRWEPRLFFVGKNDDR